MAAPVNKVLPLTQQEFSKKISEHDEKLPKNSRYRIGNKWRRSAFVPFTEWAKIKQSNDREALRNHEEIVAQKNPELLGVFGKLWEHLPSADSPASQKTERVYSNVKVRAKSEQAAFSAPPQKSGSAGRLMDKQWARIEELLNDLEDDRKELNLTSERNQGIINRNNARLKQRGWLPSAEDPLVFIKTGFGRESKASVGSSESRSQNDGLSSVSYSSNNARLNSMLRDIRNNLICQVNLEKCDLNDDDIVLLAQALQANSSVHDLKLGNNNITARGAKILAKRLSANLCAVRQIDLSNNRIGDEGACAFTIALRNKKSRRNLIGINLSGNSIGWRGIQGIAEGIKSSRSIRAVDLSHNPIGAKGFDALGNVLKQQPSLLTLNLNATGLEKDGARQLAKGLAENRFLQSLELSSNPLGYEGGVELAKIIPKMFLNSLYLNNTGIFDVPVGGDFANLSGIFQKNKSLRLIEVSENNIINENMQYLADWICTEGHVLGDLDMRDCGIDDQGIEAFCALIAGKNRLVSMNLDGNPITANGKEAIMTAVENRSLRGKTLTDSKSIPLTNDDRVRLDYAERKNCFLAKIRPEERNQYHELLSKNPSCSLKRIDWSLFRFARGEVTLLAEALEDNQSVETLRLYHCDLVDIEIAALGRMLAKNKTLKTVDLSHNLVKDSGAKAIFEGLAENTSIESFNFSRNILGTRFFPLFSMPVDFVSNDDSAAYPALENMLRRNQTIKNLDLSRTGMGNFGATAIARGMQENRSIVELNILNNLIGLEGAKELAGKIASHSSLKSLNLSENHLGGQEGIKSLDRAVQRNNNGMKVILGAFQGIDVLLKDKAPSYPKSLVDYISFLEAKKESFPKAFGRLGIDEDDELMCGITYDVPAIPVRVGSSAMIYDYRSLEGLSVDYNGDRLDPYTRIKFKLADAKPAIDVAKQFDKMIEMAEASDD